MYAIYLEIIRQVLSFNLHKVPLRNLEDFANVASKRTFWTFIRRIHSPTQFHLNAMIRLELVKTNLAARDQRVIRLFRELKSRGNMSDHQFPLSF